MSSIEELELSDYGSTPPPPPPPPPPPFGGYQQQGYGAAPSGAPLASWIQRFLAYLIDYALFLPFLVMQIVFSLKTVTTNVNGVENTTQSGGSGLALLMSLIGLAIWGYNRWHKGGQGRSLGKQVLGLTLVAESTGQPIGTGMAFVRDLAHFFDQLICFIGFLFPLWDPKRQTIADKIMTTVVTTKA